MATASRSSSPSGNAGSVHRVAHPFVAVQRAGVTGAILGLANTVPELHRRIRRRPRGAGEGGPAAPRLTARLSGSFQADGRGGLGHIGRRSAAPRAGGVVRADSAVASRLEDPVSRRFHTRGATRLGSPSLGRPRPPPTSKELTAGLLKAKGRGARRSTLVLPHRDGVVACAGGRRSAACWMGGWVMSSGVRAGRWFAGEAGVGKTALLESASDMTVLRAVGVEPEMERANASLHHLCAPLPTGGRDM